MALVHDGMRSVFSWSKAAGISYEVFIISRKSMIVTQIKLTQAQIVASILRETSLVNEAPFLLIKCKLCSSIPYAAIWNVVANAVWPNGTP